MKKLMRWTKKPVTWGGYAKYTIVCTVISGLITFVCWIATWEPTRFTKTKKLIKGIFRKKSEEYPRSEKTES